MSTEDCFICQGPCERHANTHLSLYFIECSHCGSYCIRNNIFYGHGEVLKNATKRQIANIKYFLVGKKYFEITEDNIGKLLSIQTPSIQERYQQLLLALDKESDMIGSDIYISREKYDLIGSVKAIDYNEFIQFVIFLRSENYIAFDLNANTNEGVATITFKGLSYIESIKSTRPNSSQGFIAMWFDENLKHIYNVAIKPAIEMAGYEAKRIDLHEHNNDITDEIIAQIRRSKFLVADYTGHRGGVYYEAGFARGLGLEVFMTCRKDELNKLHFDINHQVCIDWTEDNLAEFSKKLSNKIEATLGRGPLFADE